MATRTATEDGLPPVLMPDIDFSRGEIPDLHERITELRREGPVVRVMFHGAPTWFILDHDVLTDAFLDIENMDPAQGYLEIAAPTMGRTVQTMSGDEHLLHRSLVNHPFLPKQVRGYVESIFEPVAHELLDQIVDNRVIDFVQAFMRPYPFRIITRLLGVPISDEPLLLQWSEKLFDYPWDPEGALEAKENFTRYVQPIIDARRTEPRDDIISILAHVEKDGNRLSDDEILAFVRLLFPGGYDTTYRVGSSMFSYVLQRPDLKEAALRSEEERDAIVNETLRIQTSTATLPRKASGDREIGGARIRKGDWMIFGITAANRDPKVFPEPERFDHRRKGTKNRILSFGRGRHLCIGMHLARRDLEVALRIVLERFPDMELVEKPEYVNGLGMIRGAKRLMVRPFGANA